MEKLPQLRQGELPACTNKNMHTHINTAIYTYVCGHCKCFLPRFLSRFSQFSCTGRDGWWKGGGGRFESDFPRDCRERWRGGGARTVEGSSAFCFCYELRMLSCAARPHRTTKVRLRRGHTYRHIHICLWALQMFFCHVLWADSVSFLHGTGWLVKRRRRTLWERLPPRLQRTLKRRWCQNCWGQFRFLFLLRT